MTKMLGYQSNVRFFGQGEGITILKLNANQFSPILYRKDRLGNWQIGPGLCSGTCDKIDLLNTNASIALTPYTNIEVGNMTLDGNAAGQTGGNPGAWGWWDNALFFLKTDGVYLHDIEIKNGRQDGIQFNVSKNSTVTRFNVHDNVGLTGVTVNGGNQITINFSYNYGGGAGCVGDGWGVDGGFNNFTDGFISIGSGHGNAWISQWSYHDKLQRVHIDGGSSGNGAVGADGSAGTQILNNDLYRSRIGVSNTPCGTGGGVMHPIDVKVIGNHLNLPMNTNAGSWRGGAIEIRNTSAALVDGNTTRTDSCPGGGGVVCGAIAVISDDPVNTPSNNVVVTRNHTLAKTVSTSDYGLLLHNAWGVIADSNEFGCYANCVLLDGSHMASLTSNTFTPFLNGIAAARTYGVSHVNGSYGFKLVGNTFTDTTPTSQLSFFQTFNSTDTVNGFTSLTLVNHMPDTISGNVESANIVASLATVGVPFASLKTPSGGTWQGNGVANTGTFETRDIVWSNKFITGNTTPFANFCTTSGTLGTLNGGATNGTTSIGSPTVVVTSTTGLAVGAYIRVAGEAFTGSLDPYGASVAPGVKVMAISGLNVTVSANATTGVGPATVSFSSPVFKSSPNVP